MSRSLVRILVGRVNAHIICLCVIVLRRVVRHNWWKIWVLWNLLDEVSSCYAVLYGIIGGRYGFYGTYWMKCHRATPCCTA